MALKETLARLEAKYHERFLRWARAGAEELSPEEVKKCQQAVADMEKVAEIMETDGWEVLERQLKERLEIVKDGLLKLEPHRLRWMGSARLQGVGVGLQQALVLPEEIVERGQRARLMLARHEAAVMERQRRVERV